MTGDYGHFIFSLEKTPGLIINPDNFNYRDYVGDSDVNDLSIICVSAGTLP